MKTTHFGFAALFMLFVASVYGQAQGCAPGFPRFSVLVNAGMDFKLGTSNTELDRDFTLPLAKAGFTAGGDGAWFFSKNYGVGLKYRFYTSGKENGSSASEYSDPAYQYTIDNSVVEYSKYSFMETTHFASPALYARWNPGGIRWTVTANAGAGFLHNKLSKMKREVNYISHYDGWTNSGDLPAGIRQSYADLSGNAIAVGLSAGIRFQVTPLIGVGVQTNGLFASISKMKFRNVLTGERDTMDISRRINKVGLSAGIDFSF